MTENVFYAICNGNRDIVNENDNKDDDSVKKIKKETHTFAEEARRWNMFK